MSVGDGRKRRPSTRGQARTGQIGLRLSDEENTLLSSAAARCGQKTAAWLIEAGLRAAGGTLYTSDDVNDATDAAADMLIEELRLGERDTDLLRLVAAAAAGKLANPDITLDDVASSAYDGVTAEQMRGWWTSWS
jgi:uncharacterized protein (DUF1778 family)